MRVSCGSVPVFVFVRIRVGRWRPRPSEKKLTFPPRALVRRYGACRRPQQRVLYVTKEVATVRTEGAVGEFTTEEALKRLLTRTGLILQVKLRF